MRNVPAQILWGFLYILQHYVMPFFLGSLGLVFTYQSMKRLEQWLYPPPPRLRYQTYKAMYQKGHTRPALKAFRWLVQTERYDMAVLSLAAHEIYVAEAPVEGLRILREARANNDLILQQAAADTMAEDAKIIMEGNAVMVKLSARMAKQDYLGIVES
jgi:hypothetical protein